MIPKVIHYCWFGGNPLPELALKCIESWKKYCPDYEIVEWNEENFDISQAPLYVRQAYDCKKWAFVTDYVRLQVVCDNGGVYLDTDVEIIKPIDDLLVYNSFFGFESNYYINTGVGFGAVKGHALLEVLMKDYENIPFILENGELDLLTCPQRNSHVFFDYGFTKENKRQLIDKNILLSTEYFSPKNARTDQINITENTYAIHHFSCSWQTADRLYFAELRKQIYKKKILHNAPEIIVDSICEILATIKFFGFSKLVCKGISFISRGLKFEK